MTQWADFFPEIPSYKKTKNPRVFETPYVRTPKGDWEKTYFACTTEGSCFGASITKPRKAVGSTKADEKKCFVKVLQAVYHYEQYGEWPKE